MSVRLIAKRTNLSIATVSLALRNHPRISIATRGRVKAAARQCGYTRNPRIAQVMDAVRDGAGEQSRGCLGVMSLYDQPRPWEDSGHLSLIFDGMTRRAERLGYRLEPMWLRAPKMTPRRFNSILAARGIEGVLCFGGPAVDETLPAEFDRCAIVTQGVSIKTPLHRVISNAYADTVATLDRLHELGYRRPGLILSDYEHARGAHAHLSAYLGWCHQRHGPSSALPVLPDTGLDERPFLQWLKKCRPDVLVCVHGQDEVNELCAIMIRHQISIPGDIGVAAISQLLDDQTVSGMTENQHLIGSWAVELLVARIMNRDFGIPSRPRVEMVDGVWRNGRTLRQVTPAAVNV
jgi:LacI family transcriptional regulator